MSTPALPHSLQANLALAPRPSGPLPDCGRFPKVRRRSRNLTVSTRGTGATASIGPEPPGPFRPSPARDPPDGRRRPAAGPEPGGRLAAAFPGWPAARSTSRSTATSRPLRAWLARNHTRHGVSPGEVYETHRRRCPVCLRRHTGARCYAFGFRLTFTILDHNL